MSSRLPAVPAYGNVKKRRKTLSEMSARHLRRLKKEVTFPLTSTSKSKPKSDKLLTRTAEQFPSVSQSVVATVNHELGMVHARSEESVLVVEGATSRRNSFHPGGGIEKDCGSGSETGLASNNILNNELFSGSIEIDDSSDHEEEGELNDDEQPFDRGVLIADDDVEINMVKDLASWAVRRNVNQSALRDLLCILRKHPSHANLPKDPRTLLKTPKSIPFRDMPPGQFCYVGIAKGLRDLLAVSENQNYLTEKALNLMVNIDGVPIAKSSNSVLWPILGSVKETSKVFLIGRYHGYEKPADSNDLMSEFVEEIIELMNGGLVHNSQHYNVVLDAIVCDAPAKSFLLNVKGHGRYSGCTKCCEEGEYQRNRMCFHELNSMLRTDDSFRSHTDDEFHTGRTILESVPNLGLVSNIPLDYLHLVLLGVIRKLITVWTSGDLRVRLSRHQVDQISSRLSNLSQYIPSEFQRNPTSLKGACSWKGTENRLFLLYTCPVATKGILREDVYENFMVLHVAISILASIKYHVQHQEYAESLLRYFVESFKGIYGDYLVSHNVHGLIHLAKDVEKYGPLDSFSAFKFENYNQFLKKQKRKREKPLQQIVRRAAEKSFVHTSEENLMPNEIQLKQSHSDGPLINGTTGPQYKVVVTPMFRLGISKKNSCCGLEDGSVVVVENIASSFEDGGTVIIGKRIGYNESFWCVTSHGVVAFKKCGHEIHPTAC